jgi:hypothetical protein
MEGPEFDGTRVELCRTFEGRREPGDEERDRRGRCNRNNCGRAAEFRLRSKHEGSEGSMAALREEDGRADPIRDTLFSSA